MFKRSDYSPGDVINEYGNIYIKDAEDNKKNIITNCYRCGDIIEKRWDKLKNGATCNSCGWIISGEKRTKYHYENQKTFPVLLSEKGNKLRFDFCIYLNGHKNSDRLLLIELDGPQHFFPVEVFGGEESFNKLKLHDSLKDSFVNGSENIFLVKIPYTDFKLIDDDFVKDIVEKYNYKHSIGGEGHR